MKLLIPMDGDNAQESEITKVLEANKWAEVVVEEGQVVECNFHDKWEDITPWPEAIVVNNDHEPVMEFIEMSMMPLVAHTQQNIDDIVEAYLFRELHDMPY